MVRHSLILGPIIATHTTFLLQLRYLPKDKQRRYICNVILRVLQFFLTPHIKLNNFSISNAMFMKHEPYQFQPRHISFYKCSENTSSKNLIFSQLKKGDIFFSIFKRCYICFTPYKNGHILKYQRMLQFSFHVNRYWPVCKIFFQIKIHQSFTIFPYKIFLGSSITKNLPSPFLLSNVVCFNLKLKVNVPISYVQCLPAIKCNTCK